MKNKAGYTAIPVAGGWAGAEMRVFTLFNSCTPTDGRTDGWTKALIELRVRNKKEDRNNHDSPTTLNQHGKEAKLMEKVV